MKLFSAQNIGYKEFSLIEFRSELEALPLLNKLPDHVKIIDLFSLSNDHFVSFVSCNDLKKSVASIEDHESVVGIFHTDKMIVETLEAYYYLNKVSISDSVLVLETENFYKLFELMNHALLSNLAILDIKNQRSFAKNTLYITGSLTDLKSFETTLKNVNHILLDKVSASLHQIF